VKLTAIFEAVTPPNQEMRQVSNQELMQLLGKGRVNAMARHPWFQRYSNYEKAYKYGVTSYGAIHVEMYAFMRSQHTTPEGKIRPLNMVTFTFWHNGRKVIQANEYYRDKEPSDMEQRYGPSAGWKHMKTWKDVEENINEGGWDTAATQSTVVTPQIVKKALTVIQKFATDFNEWLIKQGIEDQIQIGHPLGSSAYHDVDPDDKVYGDIDLQVIVPDMDGVHSAMQNQWNDRQQQFVETVAPEYVLLGGESKPGHPIVKIGPDQYVQVDFIWHIKRNADWGRYRATPERGLKGLLNGNMFSVLGALLDMSIQHAGVQLKVNDRGEHVSFSTRKNTSVQTISSSPTTFIVDILHYVASQAGLDRKQVRIDPQLKSHPGVNTKDIKIAFLAEGIIGLAKSFELNDLYGKGILSEYHSAEEFIAAFKHEYSTKVEVEISSKKRDKAATPEAIARAEHDRHAIQQGLQTVMSYFG